MTNIHAVEIKNTAERLSKLIDLTNREIKMINDNMYSSPELKHRLFELYTEKIKLLREKETAEMLKDDPQTVIKRGKDSYYSVSLEQYQTTQKYGISVINNNQSYPKIAEIYYTLAINSRDFGTNKETEGFLKLSIKNSKDNSRTMHNAKTSLAEYYYNEKRYGDAVTFYDEILKNKSDEWYGKHLYNASWCHLKEKHFSKALSLIRESFETTKDKKYVSMREQILNAIGIFYVQADMAHDAIGFYEKNTNPAAPYLLMLANSSMNKSNFQITDEILRAALKDTQNRKDINGELKVRLSQLDIYRESKKDELFFTTSNNIVELYKKNPKLPVEDIEIAKNKIKDIAGFFQINLAKNKNKEVVNYSKDDYRKVIKYFDMLTVLDKPNKHQYRYYQGETALSVKDFHNAIKYYVRATISAKKLKSKDEYTKKSLEAMLSILDDIELSKNLKNEYVIYTYKNFLVTFPTSDKSQVLYQKLFNKYFELKKTKKATNVLLVYNKYYPSDDKIHREMLTQLLDHYIKRKNTDMIAAWVNLIEKGFLNFTSEYIQNSIAVLGDLLFDRYHTLEKKGKIKEAMNGYEDIYDSKKYPNKIKAEAAYAMSAALLDLNNATKSFKWLQKSLEIYANKDLAKITNSLYAMNKNYRLLQSFETTILLSKLVLTKFCHEEIEQKDGFFELYLTTTAMNELNAKKLLAIENEMKDCGIKEKSIKKARGIALEMMIDNDQFIEAKEYYLSADHTDSSKALFGNFAKFKFFQSPDLYSREILEIGKLNPDFKLVELVTHLEQIKAYKEKLNSFKVELSVSEVFDAKIYNSELEQYLSMVNQFAKEATLLAKESTPEEIILIREDLTKPIYALKNAILSYIPKGVDNKYLQGFQSGMRQVSESLTSKASQFDSEKRQFLEKNNYFFQNQKHVTFEKSKANEEINVLDNHLALTFSNTLDINIANGKGLAQGQR
jgi:hypothetical protein